MKESFNPYESEYDLMFEHEDSYWWYKGLREILYYWIDKLNPTIILDAGCGTGKNIVSLSDGKKQIYGIDISDKAVSCCEKFKLKNISKGNISKLPYKDQMFDCIYCMDVFGNITTEEINQTLNEFYRCLKNGGYFIINMAALQWLYSQHDLAWDIKKRYTVDELCNLLLTHKLFPIKATYRVFVLFIPVLVVKLTKSTVARLTKKMAKTGDLRRINPALNYILTMCMRLENYLLRYINFPIGSSAFIVAKKIS